jgi:arginine deiminase
MHRRHFLAAIAATGVARPAEAGRRRKPSLSSDFGTLKRVLVHVPGPETDKPSLPRGEPETPGLVVRNPPLTAIGRGQYREFLALLRRERAEVVFLKDMLDEAIPRCIDAGLFEAWIEDEIPLLSGWEDEVTSSILIGAETLLEDIPDDDGIPRPAIPPLRLMFFVRDIAAMTPRGLVLGNLAKRSRNFEPSLLRFALRWTPSLRGCPVAFDAAKEGVWLQGGDLIVADDRTILLGVGNLTAEAAARPLARKLGMDVVTVQLPGSRFVRRGEVFGGWDSLRSLFLHLDSVFNLVGPKRALTVPYFLEEQYARPESLMAIAKGCPEVMEESGRTWKDLEAIGRVRLFRAKSGEPDPKVEGLKLVDFLRSRGYEFLETGGPSPVKVDVDYLRERAIPEMNAQGTNVLAVGPNRLLAFDGTPHTRSALKARGIDVSTFACSDLVRWHGGPHCLSMPLERAALV